MKIRYTVKLITYVSVIIVKLYDKTKKQHIKVGITLSKPDDHRLLVFDEIPSTKNYNAIIELIINNNVRGKTFNGKISHKPTEEQADIFMYYISNFCKDPFVLEFIENNHTD